MIKEIKLYLKNLVNNNKKLKFDYTHLYDASTAKIQFLTGI